MRFLEGIYRVLRNGFVCNLNWRDLHNAGELVRFALSVVRSRNVDFEYYLPSNVPAPSIGVTIVPSTLYSFSDNLWSRGVTSNEIGNAYATVGVPRQGPLQLLYLPFIRR